MRTADREQPGLQDDFRRGGYVWIYRYDFWGNGIKAPIRPKPWRGIWLAYGYEVKDCEPEQETAFKAWLAVETDRMPEKMPCGSFPERLCAYFASLCDKQRGITNIPYLEKYKFIAK